MNKPGNLRSINYDVHLRYFKDSIGIQFGSTVFVISFDEMMECYILCTNSIYGNNLKYHDYEFKTEYEAVLFVLKTIDNATHNL